MFISMFYNSFLVHLRFVCAYLSLVCQCTCHSCISFFAVSVHQLLILVTFLLHLSKCLTRGNVSCSSCLRCCEFFFRHQFIPALVLFISFSQTLDYMQFVPPFSAKFVNGVSVTVRTYGCYFIQGAHSLHAQSNNKQGAPSVSRRATASHVDAIPHRSLINPFRPDQFYVRTTANRRRWIHVFPVDEMVFWMIFKASFLL